MIQIYVFREKYPKEIKHLNSDDNSGVGLWVTHDHLPSSTSVDMGESHSQVKARQWHYHQIWTGQCLFLPCLSPQHQASSPTPGICPLPARWELPGGQSTLKELCSPGIWAVPGSLLNSNGRNVSVPKDWGKNGLHI